MLEENGICFHSLTKTYQTIYTIIRRKVGRRELLLTYLPNPNSYLSIYEEEKKTIEVYPYERTWN